MRTVLVSASSFMLACGSIAQQPPGGGWGRLNLFALIDGSVVQNLVFEPLGACPPKETVGDCKVEDDLAPLDCTATSPVFPHAGTITFSSGGGSVSSVPDDTGVYRVGGLAGLTLGSPIHVHAQGATVPTFDVDVTIPDGVFAFVAPADGAAVSRSSPLAVTWTATGDAPLADVRVIGVSRSLLCESPSAELKARVPPALLVSFDPSAKSFVSLKPSVSSTLHLRGWDVEVLAEGQFDLRGITFTP